MKTIIPSTESDSRFKRHFIREAIRYVVICLFLFLLNYCTSSHYWWAAWVAAGWGLHLLLEGLFHLFGCDEEK